MSNPDEDGKVPEPPPPYHRSFEARGIHPPTFSALKPRDYRFPGSQSFSHLAWNCDGKKLAAVGIDRAVRVWNPDKSLEPRSATLYHGGHEGDCDYVSWNPTHPDLFCSSSQRDRKITFWDARQSRNIQQVICSSSPIQTAYSPDGRHILWVSGPGSYQTVHFLEHGKYVEENPKTREKRDREGWFHKFIPDPRSTARGDNPPKAMIAPNASLATWDNSGEHVLISYMNNSSVRAINFPNVNSITISAPAHVGGSQSLTFDPRGRYLATGGMDSMVNLFDLEDWTCARTITSCDYGITCLSFSHDGEYIAIANKGSFIDICGVETGDLLHRVPAPAPAPVVAFHPSRYIIAYCGQTKPEEPGPPPTTTISLFGLLE